MEEMRVESLLVTVVFFPLRKMRGWSGGWGPLELRILECLNFNEQGVGKGKVVSSSR